MQKVRTINWLFCALFLAWCTASTQAWSQTSATLNDVIARAKDEKLRETQGRKSADTTKDAGDSIRVLDAPQLVALYGVGTAMTAELSYDGHIQVIRKSGSLEKMGVWSHIDIFENSVRLTTRQWRMGVIMPKGSGGAGKPKSQDTKKPEITPVAEKLCTEKSGCLMLSVVTGTQGRQVSGTPVDPMAALLVNQSAQGPGVPFLGKPTPSAPPAR